VEVLELPLAMGQISGSCNNQKHWQFAGGVTYIILSNSRVLLLHTAGITLSVLLFHFSWKNESFTPTTINLDPQP